MANYLLKEIAARDKCELFVWDDGTVTFNAEFNERIKSLDLDREESRDLYNNLKRFYDKE